MIVLTKKQIKYCIPLSICLAYVDYSDSLDESFPELQKCISDPNNSNLLDLIDEWYGEMQFSICNDIYKEVVKELSKKYDYDENELTIWLEDKGLDDYIKDIIRERDNSNVFDDLINNTRTFLMHYDTGYELPSDSWNWEREQVVEQREAIKEHLFMITDEFDEDLDMVISQATYGGQVMLFFNDKELVKQIFKGEKFTTISFKNFMLGIVDHYNGSGDVMSRPISCEVVLEYKPENLWFEKAVKYNWTYSIAGMCEDWADSTNVQLGNMLIAKSVKTSPQVVLQQNEERYNETFRKGGCSFGDMDINRHRNKEYINHFPCGTKCHDCGTFWID